MEIAQTIKGIFEIENISTSHDNVISKAVEVYASTKLDFVDCLMVGYSKIKGYFVFTFDKDLKKYL